jgi:hypothetical protein
VASVLKVLWHREHGDAANSIRVRSGIRGKSSRAGKKVGVGNTKDVFRTAAAQALPYTGPHFGSGSTLICQIPAMGVSVPRSLIRVPRHQALPSNMAPLHLMYG